MITAVLSTLFTVMTPAPETAPLVVPDALQDGTKETLVIEAEGSGATESDALQQALMSAVSAAVGALIDAETIVENDRVIKERILSASNGFVEKYEKLESRQSPGGWTVRIRATVRSGTLQERIDQSIHRSTSSVDGQNLGQRIKTKQRVAQDQGDLIRLAIGECRNGVLKIERVGEPTAVESPELPDGTVRLRITVRISVDDKAWRVRMEKAQTTLSELAIAKASTVIPLRKCAPVEEVNDRSGSVRIEREKPANVDGMVLDAPSLASMDPEAAIGRSGRFLPQIWHAAVEAGPGDTAFTSKLRDSILLRSLVTESRARNQNLAVACIIDRKPESTSVTVHSFVVPEAVLDGCFRGYTGRLALSASALDVSGSEISGGTAGLSVLGAWSLDPELGFNGGVAVSGLMRQAFLLGGRGRLDLASNPDLGSGLSITQGGREQKPSILVIAPGAAYLNPCGPSCYSGMAIASSWTGDMFLDLPDSALESMESLRLEIEPK